MMEYIIGYLILSLVVGTISFGVNIAFVEKKYRVSVYIMVFLMWFFAWHLVWLVVIGFKLGELWRNA